MKVKVFKATLSTYWYANKIGKVFDVTKAVNGDYILRDKVRWIGKEDCCPLKTKKARKPAPNSDYTAALWRELNRRQGNGRVPLHIYWIAVTKERLKVEKFTSTNKPSMPCATKTCRKCVGYCSAEKLCTYHNAPHTAHIG